MPARVLLVAGHSAAALSMEFLLVDAGHAVERACDRAEALPAFARARPDAVVVDASLPGGGGFAVLEALRRGDADRVPVVMLVPRAGSVEHRKALALGADAVLSCPFAGPTLVAAVEAAARDDGPAPPRQMAADGGGDAPHHA